MDDYELDRYSETLGAVVAMITVTGKLPSVPDLQAYLSAVYEFLTQDDVYISEGEDNIVTISKEKK